MDKASDYESGDSRFESSRSGFFSLRYENLNALEISESFII